MRLIAAAVVAVALVVFAGCDDATRPVPADASDADDSVPDAADPCASCGEQMCVQFLDGPCGSAGVECVPKVTGCETPVCSNACDDAYCGAGGTSTCMAAGCPADLPGAFHCYGV